jgi:hypothetical protein
MSDNAARTGVFVVLGCVGIAVVVGMGVASWLFFSAVKGGSVDEVAQHLPSDTTSLAVIRGVGDLAVEFREVLTLAETGKSGNKDLEEIRREGQRVLGFDPTSLQAWMDSGLDFTRPWAAATSARLEDMERGIWTVWVPVSDAERVLAMVEQMVKEAGGEHSVTSGEHLIRSRNRDRMAYRLVEDFLVISFSPGHASAAQLRYTPPADGESLSDQDAFKDAVSAAGNDWHVLNYGAPVLVAQMLDEMAREAGLPASALSGLGLQSYASTLHLANEAASVGYVLTHNDKAGLRPILPEKTQDTLGKRIPGTPYFVARISLNPKGVWTMLENNPEMGRDLIRAREELSGELDIDLKTGVVDTLEGNTALAVLQGGKLGFDIVAYSDIEDGKRFGETAEKVVNKLRFVTGGLLDVERGDEGTWISMNDNVLGLTEDHVVFSTRPRTQIRTQVVDGGGESYLSRLPTDVRSGMESGPAVYAYLDVLAAIDGLKGASRMVQGLLGTKANLAALDDVKQVLRGAGLSLGQTDESMNAKFVVYAGSEGFSKGLVGLVQKHGATGTR